MFSKIIASIESYDVITIFGHTSPDGDCYGSQIALRDCIKAKYPNKKVYAIGEGWNALSNSLGQMDIVSLSTIEESLAILVDTSDFSRVGDQRIIHAKAFAKIDHHVDCGAFISGPFVVDEEAVATTAMIFQMIKENDWPINKNIAQALFLGIMTDSGRFQYTNDFSNMFSSLAELCELGAKPEELCNILNVTKDKELSFKGYVFNNYKKTSSGIAYLYLNLETLNKFNFTSEQANGMVNLIAHIEGCRMWIFITEFPNSSVHVELRSIDVDVQKIAYKYGGGGHRLASGATINNFKEKDVLGFIRKIEQYITCDNEEF